MKFKKKDKKEKTKQTSSSSRQKSSFPKDEIKEIVEDAVEAVLKEQEKEKQISLQKDNSPEENIVTQEVPTAMPETKDTTTEIISSEKEISPSVAPEKTTPVVSTTVSQNPTPTTDLFGESSQTTNKKSSKKLFYLTFLLVVLAILGAGVFFVISHRMVKLKITTSAINPTVYPTKSQNPISTPTAKQQVDISTYTISVLNGSGIAGAAAKVKTLLTTAGFTVNNIGNAAGTSNFTDTVISAKSSVDSNTIAKLIQTLEKNYSVSPQTSKLSSTESADIIVTVGSITK